MKVWISVDVATPNNSRDILIYGSDNIDIGFYDYWHGKFFSYKDDEHDNTIKYWQELPEVPNE